MANEKSVIIDFGNGPVEYPVIDARKFKRITGRLPFAGNGRTLRPVCATNFVGRDCDGYDMDNVRCFLPETIKADIMHAAEWLDGPGRWLPMRERDLIEYCAPHAEEDRRRYMRYGW